MNLDKVDFEVLDLGLIYYKNIIKDPQALILEIESLDKKINEENIPFSETSVRPWTPWKNESGNKETFCLQKFIPQVKDIQENDIYKKEQTNISSQLFGALENTLTHYSTELYPWAENNIKSREKNMHLLRYDYSGYLPAHLL